MAKDIQKLLRSLNAPGVSAFLDTRKLADSGEFIEMADFAVAHMLQHGDSIYVADVVKLFAQSGRFEPTLRWMCDRAGLDFSFEGGDLVLRKLKKSQPNPGASLTQYLTSTSGKGTAEAMAKAWLQRSRVRRKSEDILDSWLVLPGCFEQGERR